MSQDSVADDELAAFVDRILRMKSEEDAIKSDIKEIYAEAKGRGYDKTRLGETVATVRKRDKDATGEAEKEVVRDLYLTAYYRSKNKPHTHAYARGGWSTTTNTSHSRRDSDEIGVDGTTPEHDAETSEITEPQSVPQAAKMQQAPAPASATTSPAGAECIEDRQTIQPETANTVPSPAAAPAEANIGGDDEVPEPAEQVILDRRPGTVASEAGESGSEHQRAERIETYEAPAGRVADESPAPTFKPLRPHCLKPEACGGSGKKHCWSCTKAMNEAGEVA